MRAAGFAGAEFGNSNLWFPNSSIEPAAAGGTGHCPVAEGFAWSAPAPSAGSACLNRRQQPAVGTADLSDMDLTWRGFPI